MEYVVIAIPVVQIIFVIYMVFFKIIPLTKKSRATQQKLRRYRAFEGIEQTMERVGFNMNTNFFTKMDVLNYKGKLLAIEVEESD